MKIISRRSRKTRRDKGKKRGKYRRKVALQGKIAGGLVLGVGGLGAVALAQRKAKAKTGSTVTPPTGAAKPGNTIARTNQLSGRSPNKLRGSSAAAALPPGKPLLPPRKRRTNQTAVIENAPIVVRGPKRGNLKKRSLASKAGRLARQVKDIIPNPDLDRRTFLQRGSTQAVKLGKKKSVEVIAPIDKLKAAKKLATTAAQDLAELEYKGKKVTSRRNFLTGGLKKVGTRAAFNPEVTVKVTKAGARRMGRSINVMNEASKTIEEMAGVKMPKRIRAIWKILGFHRRDRVHQLVVGAIAHL